MARPTLIAGRIAAENRRARHEYSILETIEAGVMLAGTEVKSLRSGRANLAEAFAGQQRGEFRRLAGGQQRGRDRRRDQRLGRQAGAEFLGQRAGFAQAKPRAA